MRPDEVRHRYASEAFAGVTCVPWTKAWRKDDDVVVLLDQVRISRRADGTIAAVGSDGRDVDLPLMITADWVHAMVGNALNGQVASPAFRPADYASDLDRWIAEGTCDRRLSPKSRAILAASAPRPGHGRHRRIDGQTGDHLLRELRSGQLRDHLLREMCDAEIASFRSRVHTRSLGYARGGATGIAKMANSLLWADVWDREVANAAVLAFGHKATVGNYNRMVSAWRRKDPSSGRDAGIRALLSTHRPAFVIHSSVEGRRRSEPVEVATHRSALASIFEAVIPARFHPAAPPANVEDLCGVIASTPRILREAGLKPSVWRMLLRMSVPQVAALRILFQTALVGADQDGWLFCDEDRKGPSSQETARNLINRLSELDAQAAPRTVLMSLSILGHDQQKAVLPLLKAILAESLAARRRGAVKRMARQIGPTADAFASFTRTGDPIASTPNIPWNAMQRHQQRWHMGEAGYQSPEEMDLEWDPLLPAHSTPVASAVELCTSEALRRETADMGHCVASYAGRCHGPDAVTRIFSLRLRERPSVRSTVELRLGASGLWYVAQHRSQGNDPPHTKLASWTKSLVAAANKAHASRRAAAPRRLAA